MHKKLHLASVLLVGLIIPAGLIAQFVETDLESYLKQAQSANPGLQAFEQHYEAALQRIPQASGLPDPMLQITHFVESVQTRTGPQENVIMLSQRLPWFGKLDNREDVASAQAEALWYAFQAQQLMVAQSVAVAYFEYGYTGRAIQLTVENLKLLESLIPIVESRVRGGGDLNPLIRLQVEIGKVTDLRQSLQQKRAIQSAALKNLLALQSEELLPWPGWSAPDAVMVDGSSLALAIEANNPALAMLERRIASSEARREIARLESYPDITLGLNYIQIGDPVVNPGTMDAGKDPWGLTVSVNLPLWGGKNRAGQSEALASKRASEFEYQNRLNALRADLSASIAKLTDAQRRLNLYGEELLSLAEQSVEISRTSYENNKAGILEVIDSERTLLELQMLFWRAASDAWQQRVIIQSLANQPLLGTFNATSDK